MSDIDLLEAVMTQDVDAATELLAAGSDVNHANAAGMTPLIVCSGGVGPAPLMEVRGRGPRPGFCRGAARRSETRAVPPRSRPSLQALLKAGARVNQCDAMGWSPLIYVSSTGQLPLLLLLLAAGAAVNHQATDKAAWCPLTRAAYRGQVEVIRLLLAAGADASIRSQVRGRCNHHRRAAVPPPSQSRASIIMAVTPRGAAGKDGAGHRTGAGGCCGQWRRPFPPDHCAAGGGVCSGGGD